MNIWQNLQKKCKKQNRPILALAPMAGITDSAYRFICKKFGADIVYSEMISADALHYGSKITMQMLKFRKKEKPLIVQLFGKDPEKFKKAAQLAEKSGVDGIDINFGCPATKVVRHGGGVTLMRNFKLSREIIKCVIENTKLPVSIKVRTSIMSEDSLKRINFLQFYKYIQDLDIAAIMIHGRSYEQGFAGEPNYNAIQEYIKKIRSINKNIVLLANGGIYTPENAQKMHKRTSADGLGLARGILGKPWLFKQIKDYYKKQSYSELLTSQITKIALNHAKLLIEDKPTKGIFEIRKHLAWYVKGVKNAAKIRQELVRVGSYEDIQRIFSQIKK